MLKGFSTTGRPLNQGRSLPERAEWGIECPFYLCFTLVIWDGSVSVGCAAWLPSTTTCAVPSQAAPPEGNDWGHHCLGNNVPEAQSSPGREGVGPLSQGERQRRCEGVFPAPRCLVMALPLTAQCIHSCSRTILCRVAPHHFRDSTKRKHITLPLPDCSWATLYPTVYPPMLHCPRRLCHLRPCVLSSLILLTGIVCFSRYGANSVSHDKGHTTLYIKMVSHIIHSVYLAVHILITTINYHQSKELLGLLTQCAFWERGLGDHTPHVCKSSGSSYRCFEPFWVMRVCFYFCCMQLVLGLFHCRYGFELQGCTSSVNINPALSIW